MNNASQTAGYAGTELTLVIPCYFDQNSAGSLFSLLRTYQSYADDVLARVCFVVVDDGSPLRWTLPHYDLNLVWLRINENIPWNNGGARNLGATVAHSDKILLSDMDYVFPQETLRAILRKKNLGKRMYKFWCVDYELGCGRPMRPLRRFAAMLKGQSITRNGRPMGKNDNTFLLSRGRFLELFGYDEEFSGEYGSEDVHFALFHRCNGTRTLYFPPAYPCITRAEVDRGRAYHSLSRKSERNGEIFLRKKRELHTVQGGGHSRIFLNFTWQTLRVNHRPPPPRRFLGGGGRQKWPPPLCRGGVWGRRFLGEGWRSF